MMCSSSCHDNDNDELMMMTLLWYLNICVILNFR